MICPNCGCDTLSPITYSVFECRDCGRRYDKNDGCLREVESFVVADIDICS